MLKTDPLLPTGKESTSLTRISAWRPRLALLPLLPLLAVALTWMLPDEHAYWSLALAVLASAILIAVLLYVSFGLRCPRCTGWLGLTSSRCLSCGLKTAPAPDQKGK